MRKSTSVLVVAISLTILLSAARSTLGAAATDLGIRATAMSFRVGAVGTYTISVTNHGPATTDVPVHVRDLLPAGLTFAGVVNSAWSCSAAGQSVDCIFSAPLSAGVSTTFRIRVAACTAAFPSVTNTLTLDYPADTNGANNSVTKNTLVKPGTCAAPPPTVTQSRGTPVTGRTGTPTPTSTPIPSNTDLQLAKTIGSTFTVGSTAIYILTVSNLGPASTAGAVTVIDPLPSGLTFVSASGSGWSCSASGQTVSCSTSGSIAAGSNATVSLTVGVGSAAYPTVTNTATLSYAGDTNASNNTARKATTIRQ